MSVKCLVIIVADKKLLEIEVKQLFSGLHFSDMKVWRRREDWVVFMFTDDDRDYVRAVSFCNKKGGISKFSDIFIKEEKIPSLCSKKILIVTVNDPDIDDETGVKAVLSGFHFSSVSIWKRDVWTAIMVFDNMRDFEEAEGLSISKFGIRKFESLSERFVEK